MTPLPTGVGGTLFGGGGGAGGGPAASPFSTPGGVKAPSQGKNSVQQNLHSPHAGIKSTITKGQPLSRALGHYGKDHSFDPPSPLKGIRGGTGQMRRIRGGLGPGKMGQAGGSTDYSMTNADPE
jgi:hypothetical protein